MSWYKRQAGILPSAAGAPIMAVLASDGMCDDGLALQMSGCDLTRFRSNPALLVGHDAAATPVGSVRETRVEPHRFVGRLVFASDERAQVEEQRVRDGHTNAVSLRFDVDPKKVDRQGRAWRWWPLEVSLVGVGMDQNALILSRSAWGAVTEAQRRLVLDVCDPARPVTRERVNAAMAEVLAEWILTGR